MDSITKLFELPPYSLNYRNKGLLLNEILSSLTHHHYQNCEPYKRILDSINFSAGQETSYYNIPFLPVRLFKMHDLASIDKKKIIKTMTSSGTTGQTVSKIYLDKETSLLQTKTLTKIVSSFLGSKRSPMIIIDSEAVLKNRNTFSARGAGIMGFSIFGSKKTYALNEEMRLQVEKLRAFINENNNSSFFLFGFTFMIYQHFIKELERQKVELDLSRGVLIHGGGWKKLVRKSISSDKFKELLYKNCKITSVHNYYGMVEQAGSIYMECEEGYLHASNLSDIIIRRPIDFSVADHGEVGIIQVLSVLPKSYPGHSLLTEDEGAIIGEDNCKCGRFGKFFKILGRLKSAEIRGCSDTYEAS